MEDEIDIRAQILVVLRAWRAVLGLAVLAALSAGVYAWTLPNTYETEALVSITPGRISLDLSGVQQSSGVTAQAYLELAESNTVVETVFEAAGPELLDGIPSVSRLRRLLTAEASAEAPLLRLRVTDTDPARAAALANLWAETFAAQAGVLYRQDQANLVVYSEAEAEALAGLNAADAALADFQASNPINITQAQLTSQQASLTDYLNRAHEAGLLSGDLMDLLTRLESLPANAPAALADDLALLALTSRVYGGQLGTDADGQASDRLQVVVGVDQPLTSGTVADQRELAEDLLASLDARRQSLAAQAKAVEPSILALQGQVATAQAQADQLTRARDLAAETYSALAIQVQEATVAVRQAANVAQVAGRASVPSRATGPARATYLLLGAGLGAMLGVGLALAREFLRPAGSPAAPPADTRPATR
jgi:uncharacterized protein involved in exopolysaccharide biosynthesis